MLTPTTVYRQLKGDLILKEPVELTPDHKRFLDSRPDYQEKMDRLKFMLEKASLHVSLDHFILVWNINDVSSSGFLV